MVNHRITAIKRIFRGFPAFLECPGVFFMAV
jgi:hypothetical protein